MIKTAWNTIDPGKKKNILFAALLSLLCVALVFVPTGYENRKYENSHLARAEIVSVDNTEVSQHLIVKTGFQELQVEILSGPWKGKRITAVNQLTSTMELDEMYTAGQTVLLEFSAVDGKIKWAHARGTYRLRIELVLMGLFALLLIGVAGWTGFKALITFVFTALMVWKVMMPCFLKGYDPVLVALGVVGVLTAATSFIVGGLSRKGLVTFLGAFLGLVLTCILAQVFQHGFNVHGAVRPFAEQLLYSGFYHLDLTRIFLAGIVVACSGAVMDLAMDISASMHEIAEQKPDISPLQLIGSGMAVGRAVIGTMTTTLLLAYSGSYMTMFMYFMGQGIPLQNIFNLNYVAAEVLNTFVGSFGLVTVAPFTALMGGLLYGRGKHSEKQLHRSHAVHVQHSLYPAGSGAGREDDLNAHEAVIRHDLKTARRH